MGGGELFHWLKEHRRFSEPRARLYTAEIGLGLGALHDLDIVYRAAAARESMPTANHRGRDAAAAPPPTAGKRDAAAAPPLGNPQAT